MGIIISISKVKKPERLYNLLKATQFGSDGMVIWTQDWSQNSIS